MKRAEVRALLASWNEGGEDNEPILLSRSELSCLEVRDFASGARVQVGHLRGKLRDVELDGYITKGTTTPLQLEIRETYDRKFWAAPIGMWHFLDLVRRAIETRQRTRRDVVLGQFDDSDTPCVRLNYSILLTEPSVSKAYAEGVEISKQLFEPAQIVKLAVADVIAKEAQKLSGWGALPLQDLIDHVEVQETNDNKARVLEELACKLFETIPGFQVKQRVRTETEEIDIRILNESNDPIWKREAPIIIAECKNWSSKVGKNEYALFKEKVCNRKQRCTCGFLISWNGFAKTVTKEALRGSREEPLIILVSGKDVRAAVLAGNFEATAKTLWDRAALR